MVDTLLFINTCWSLLKSLSATIKSDLVEQNKTKATKLKYEVASY